MNKEQTPALLIGIFNIVVFVCGTFLLAMNFFFSGENFNVYVPNANPGRAAKGGTYIVATPLQSVNHIFQETGTYSISVRAKDGIGLWSKWKTTQIEVEN